MSNIEVLSIKYAAEAHGRIRQIPREIPGSSDSGSPKLEELLIISFLISLRISLVTTVLFLRG